MSEEEVVPTPPTEPPAKSPRKVRKKKEPEVTPEPEKLNPLFFVELVATLKELRKAERANKLSNLKIA